MLRNVLVFMLFSTTILLSFCHAERFEDVTGLIDPSTDSGYMLIPQKYTTTTQPIYTKKTLYTAFVDLQKAAKTEGIDLRINSGRRGFAQQQLLFKQYGFDRALPPGTSSHHFGQAIDLAYTYSGGNADKRLQKNASYYGFCQTYDGKSSGQGEESRHYEYHPEEYRALVIGFRDEIYLYMKLQGVLDKTAISKQELFDRYVYPISHSCIDDYPSHLQDVITGIRFDRKLDSTSPDQLIYTLSRYKFPAGTGLLNLLPPEIRFVKSKKYGLRFAPLVIYPKHVQDLFIDYKKWFREGLERFVLLRTYQQLALMNQPKISFFENK